MWFGDMAVAADAFLSVTPEKCRCDCTAGAAHRDGTEANARRDATRRVAIPDGQSLYVVRTE